MDHAYINVGYPDFDTQTLKDSATYLDPHSLHQRCPLRTVFGHEDEKRADGLEILWEVQDAIRGEQPWEEFTNVEPLLRSMLSVFR